jgi:cytochrome c peroxidase
MRGLSARAPYFGNGSAASLREIVEIYDRRYNIRFTEQEITDLVNLMMAL